MTSREPPGVRWIGLLLAILVGTVVAAYISLVIELDRFDRGVRDR